MEMKHEHSRIFTIPNLLSLFRLCLIPVIVRFYAVTEQTYLAGGFLILSGLTDILDGFLARHYGMGSDLGKILDPFADKLTQAVMLICLILRYPMMLFPFLMMVFKELFMGITGFLVIRKRGLVLGANWHGKAATVLLHSTIFLHVFFRQIPPALSHLMIFSSCGLIGLSFLLYGVRNLHVLREGKV